MAVGRWIVPTKAKEYMMDGTIDMDDAATNAYRVGLIASGFSTNTIAQILGFELKATGEISGNTVGNKSSDPYIQVTWTPTGTTMKWTTAGTASWTSTGGSTMLPAWAYIYKENQTSPSDPVVAFLDLERTTIGSLSIANGNTLKLTFPASGIIKLSGASTPS